MSNQDFEAIVDHIYKSDSQYAKEAYYFIRQALDHAFKQKKSFNDTLHPHVSKEELLESIRELGLNQYGTLAITVFEYWGIKSCKDFGAILLNLIEAGVLGKRDAEQPEDFDKGYDFREAFVAPFLPKQKGR